MKRRYTVVGFTNHNDCAEFSRRTLQFGRAAVAGAIAQATGQPRLEILFLDRVVDPEFPPPEYEPYVTVYFLSDSAVEYAKSAGVPIEPIHSVELDDARVAELGVLLRA